MQQKAHRKRTLLTSKTSTDFHAILLTSAGLLENIKSRNINTLIPPSEIRLRGLLAAISTIMYNIEAMETASGRTMSNLHKNNCDWKNKYAVNNKNTAL